MQHCPCSICLDRKDQGVDSLLEEKAPTTVIDDYIYDMTSGEWEFCSECPDNDFDND